MRFMASFILATMLFGGPADDPSVTSTKKEAPFHLHGITTERVAIWPLPPVDLNEEVAKTVYQEYPDDIAFVENLGNRIAKRIGDLTKANPMGPAAIIASFKEDQGTRAFLRPEKLLKGLKLSSRYGIESDNPLFNALCAHPALQGVRFAVIPIEFKVGRSTSYAGGGLFFGPGVFVGGGSSSKTSAELRMAVLDIQERRLVWEGTFVSMTSSNFRKATALHEVEAGLLSEIAREIQN